MKRDLALIREILLKLEAHTDGYFMQSGGDIEKKFPDREFYEVGYHCYLLKDAVLIEASDVIQTDDGGGPWCLPLWLNWAGHEFLATLKDDGYWSKLKQTVVASGAWTFKAVLQGGIEYGIKRIIGP